MSTITIFLGSTPESAERLDSLRPLLSDEEQTRVDRIRLEHVRRRQIAALAGLRIALGRALGRDPSAVRFGRGPHGKPYLQDEAVSFNLTRSGDRFAVGIADEGALGIDIEFARPIPRLVDLARTVFTEAEMAELTACAEVDQPAAFYRGWTRKEAFIKAVGTGLHLPLRSFTVSLASGPGNALRALGEPARAAADESEAHDDRWWIGSVTDGLPEKLFAAVSWDRGEPSVRLDPFDWE